MSTNTRDDKVSSSGASIVIAIMKSNKEYLTGKELEKITGLSRQRINQERGKLKKLELIDYKTVGRRTNYYQTTKFLSLFRAANTYGNELYHKLLSSNELPIGSPYYTTRFSDKMVTERLLFELALKFGLVFCHTMFLMMRPSKINIFTIGQKSAISMSHVIKNSKLRDYIVVEMLKRILRSERLNDLFGQKFYLAGHDFLRDTRGKPNQYTFNELSEKNVKNIANAFDKLFPGIYRALEDSSNVLRSTSLQQLTNAKQFGCLHSFDVRKAGAVFNYSCNICDKEIEVRSEFIVQSPNVLQLLNSKKFYVSKCRHTWIYAPTAQGIIEDNYECLQCKMRVNLFKEERTLLELIEEKTSIRLGQGHLEALRTIEEYFHRNRNLDLTLENIVEHCARRLLSSMTIKEARKFQTIVKRILRILIEHKFVEVRKVGKKYSYLRPYALPVT